MAIEKEKFFEIIQEVSKSKNLNKDNLLEKIKNELKSKDVGEYNKFNKNFSKEHQFSIKISEEAAEDWTLLHLAVACNSPSIVKLLLQKKVSVSTRVKDGPKNDGLTPLHIAASYGYEEIVQLLLDDKRVSPLLKDAQGRIPKEIVGNVPNKNTIIEMLEKAEKGYSPKEAKGLNIKLQGGSTYRLSQSNHKAPANPAMNGDNVVENGTDPHSEQCDSIHSDESVSGDSGLELGQEETETLKVQLEELRVQLKKEQEENESLKKQIQDLKSKNTTLNSQLEKNNNQRSNYSSEQEAKLEAPRKQNQEESESSKQKIENLKKELEESKSRVAGHETRLEELSKLNEENEPLKQKIQELKNENTTLKDELEKNKNQHSKINEGWTCLHSYAVLIDFKIARAALDLGMDPDAKDKDGWTLLHHAAYGGHLDRVKYLVEGGANFEIKNKKGKSPLDLAASKQNNKVVEFLREKIKSKTGLSEGELEKTGKRQFSSKVACAGLAAMLAVGATLSIASGLSILLIIAASVTSVLIAGGVTYAVSKPTTELKEVVVQDQQYDVCKT